MGQKDQKQKKSMPLARFEFNLFKKLIQLEQILNLEKSKILLNLQISGGKDSMCLFRAFSAVLSSKIGKLKNTYTLVVQHFNHKQRGQESDEDAFFVEKACKNLEIPVFISSLSESEIKNNYQQQFRNWRKKEASNLSQRLAKELNCDKYFIVTAHHARDHVETVLLHLLRGSGIEGLKGISFLDENNVYYRPFYDVTYQEINEYCNENNIQFREDSSNAEDKYKRNYIRKHILPHFEYLQKDYENSFLKLSRHISSTKNTSSFRCEPIGEPTESISNDNTFFITKSTSPSELYYYLKTQMEMKNISENCVQNIIHEAHILLGKKEDGIMKEISIKSGRFVSLLKTEDGVSLFTAGEQSSK